MQKQFKFQVRDTEGNTAVMRAPGNTLQEAEDTLIQWLRDSPIRYEILFGEEEPT